MRTVSLDTEKPGETSASAAQTPSGAANSRVVTASAIGTIVEWYDFLIYGIAATLVLNKLFFPSFDPFVGTLATLGSYAVGFFARPLGGALFGHFGDRYGRRNMLMLSMLLMGTATCAIGLLPTYASIGIWAPVALVALRLVQGIGLGGEWGGAALLVFEHAGGHRRGLSGSLVQIGFPLGLIAATLVFSSVSSLPDADFMSWGWRIPFLLSAPLVFLGFFVRTRLDESPEFVAARQRQQLVKSPVIEATLKNRGAFLSAVGLKISEVSWIYTLTVFVVMYATSQLALPKQLLLDAIFYGAIVELAAIPLFGALSDKVGRRPLYIWGALFTAAFAFPLFWLLDSREPGLVITAVVVAMVFGHALMFAPQATYFPELFGTSVRYSGASLGFQVAAAVGGGLSPILAASLAKYFGGSAGVSVMLVGLAALTLTTALLARETRPDPQVRSTPQV